VQCKCYTFRIKASIHYFTPYQFRLLCAAAVMALTTCTRAADPALPTPQAQWRLSPYLTGSTDKIRDLINGPLESVLDRKADKLVKLNTLKTAVERKAQTLVESSSAYVQLQNQLSADQNKLASAREQQDAVTLINSENKVASDRSQMRSLLANTISTDPRLAAAEQEIEQTADEIGQLEPAVTSAAKARDQLMGGLRTSLRMMGPPATGAKGILDKIKPTRIIDAQSFTCDFDSYEIEGEAKDAPVADGFRALMATSTRIHLLVTGYNTAKLHVGSPVQLDQTFRMTGTKVVGRLSCYVVEPDDSAPRDNAFDGLFRVLDSLRVPDSVQPR
jgi:hypothetical protein